MNLKKIAAISGKPGLFKVVKPTRSGVIVESLDEKKRKEVVGAASRMSVLKELSIYTTDQEGSIPLGDVILKIYENFKTDTGLDSSASSAELMSFLKGIVPEYDEAKVYVSDVKKLISWYKLIVQYAPETLEELANGTHAEEDKADEKEQEVEAKDEKETKKPAVKKTKADNQKTVAKKTTMKKPTNRKST